MRPRPHCAIAVDGTSIAPAARRTAISPTTARTRIASLAFTRPMSVPTPFNCSWPDCRRRALVQRVVLVVLGASDADAGDGALLGELVHRHPRSHHDPTRDPAALGAALHRGHRVGAELPPGVHEVAERGRRVEDEHVPEVLD